MFYSNEFAICSIYKYTCILHCKQVVMPDVFLGKWSLELFKNDKWTFDSERLHKVAETGLNVQSEGQTVAFHISLLFFYNCTE